MLPKAHRLSQTNDFQRVLSAKRGIREDGLVLKTASSERSAPRVGVVVSKKVSKKAVERNRIRRVVQEAVRGQLKNIPRGVDIAIVVMPGFQKGNSQNMNSIIHALFQKAFLVS